MSDHVGAAIERLTAMQHIVMSMTSGFDLDAGMTASSGVWGQDMADDIRRSTGWSSGVVGGVMSHLADAGLWDVVETGEPEGRWWQLTDLGGEVAQRLAGG